MIYFILRPLRNELRNNNNQTNSNGYEVHQRLSEALSELKSLKAELRLKSSLRNANQHFLVSEIFDKTSNDAPSTHYEVKRRQIFTGVQEMMYFVQNELLKLTKEGNDRLVNLTRDIISSAKEHQRQISTPFFY